MKFFVDGRKDIFQILEQNIQTTDRTIWMHCASLGEFEQGRPILEKLRAKYKSHKIVLTFFSPSGYEVQKNYRNADVVCYLPIDSKSNSQKFVEYVHPELAIFVKYEFWPNILNELKKNDIKTLLVSGIFRKKQVFFKSTGNWMRKSIQAFSHFFVQDENSKNLLSQINFNNVSVSGDTRFDRVSEIKKQDNTLEFMDNFKKENFLFVAGSSWKEDEELLVKYINNCQINKVKFLIASHNIKRDQILKLKNSIQKKTTLYSDMDSEDISKSKVLIIDTVGLLTKIYSYADTCYVGGGFGKAGIHNILEPATFGIPTIIGPIYNMFKEANDLVHLNGVAIINNQQEFNEKCDNLIENIEDRNRIGGIASDYIKNNIGATNLILDYITNKIDV